MGAYPAAPATLDAANLDLYHRQGYLAFEGVLTPTEVDEARAALTRIIRETHAAAVAGSPAVKTVVSSGDTRQNYQGVELRKVGGGLFVDFQVGMDPLAMSSEQAELAVRKLGSYCDEDPALRRLTRHPRIMAVLESLLGPGSLLFQEMALIKPPFIGSEKPWHQDDAYFSYVPLDQVVGVWLALDAAGADNGCMHVIPGGHQRGGMRHYHSSLDCEIVPGRIHATEAKPIELEPGGALFFSGMLPHQTPINRSPRRRRALQFHYRGAATRKVEPAEYDRLFAEPDGSPASCRAAVR